MSADTAVRDGAVKAATGGAVMLCLWLASCQQEMAVQPRYDPLEKSEFFDDQRAARPLVEGTVARGLLRDDEHLYRALVNGKPADSFPFDVDKQVLLRGQEPSRFGPPCQHHALPRHRPFQRTRS